MKHWVFALLTLLPTLAHALPGEPAPTGSPNFCLFPLPAEGNTSRWLNLGIVQYVEVRADAVLITYGGGNLGSGYETRIPVKTRDEANAVLARLRQQAEDCARAASPRTP